MSPLSMLYMLFGSRVWRRSLWSLTITLVASLVSLSASAQDKKDDNPYPDDSNHPCITTVDKDRVVDGKHFSVITVSKYNPKSCELRNARAMFPILDQDKKPLGMQAWLRATFAANQGQHPTVLRRCVPVDCPIGKAGERCRQMYPPPDASDEEKILCPNGVENYFAVPSNGWHANILIPATPMPTAFEIQSAAAETACKEAKSPEAQKKCHDAGYAANTASDQAPAQSNATPPAPSTMPPAPISPSVAVSSAQADEIARLRQEKEDLNKALQTERDKVQQAEAKANKAEQGKQASDQVAAKANWSSPYLWAIIIVLVGVVLAGGIWAAKRIKRLEKGLGITEIREQLREEKLAKVAIENQLAESEARRISEADLNKADLDQLRQEKEALTAERNKAQSDLQSKKEEDTKVRAELQLKNRELQTERHTTKQCEGDNKTLIAENKRLVPFEAAATKLSKQLAVEQQTVIEKDRRIAELEEQLKAANDNAAPTAANPSTETSEPPSTETSDIPSAETEPASTIRGFPAGQPQDSRGSVSDPLDEQIRLEADAFHNGMPELIRLLDGELVVLEGADPSAIMIQTIRLATSQRTKRGQLAAELADERQKRVSAESGLRSYEQQFARLSDGLEIAERSRKRADEALQIMRDQGTEPERKTLDALFALDRKCRECDELSFSLRRTETDLVRLRTLYVLSQGALQKAVAGSDCIGTPERVASFRPEADAAALARLVDQGLSAPPVLSAVDSSEDLTVTSRPSWLTDSEPPEPAADAVATPLPEETRTEPDQSQVVDKATLMGIGTTSGASVGVQPTTISQTIRPTSLNDKPDPGNTGQGNGS